jgi:RNA polymerase primary sigma factor
VAVHANSSLARSLAQEGNCGLLFAAGRFDPGKGARFSTFASWWIRQSVGRAVKNQCRTIRLPVHVHATLDKAEKIRRDWREKKGREIGMGELAGEMGVKEEKLRSLAGASRAKRE